MKLPRDLAGNDPAKAPARLGYHPTRQEGSHIRLATHLNGEHSITVPAHDAFKVGTLSGIPSDLQKHHRLARGELLVRLFG